MLAVVYGHRCMATGACMVPIGVYMATDHLWPGVWPSVYVDTYACLFVVFVVACAGVVHGCLLKC